MVNICSEAEVEELFEVDQSKIFYEQIPEEEMWRNSVIPELLEMRAGRLETELTSKEDTTLLYTVCM